MASMAMGNVYTRMGDFENALRCHQQAAKVSQEGSDLKGHIRALRSAGGTYEAMGLIDRAIKMHETQLSVANNNEDMVGKMDALECLGKQSGTRLNETTTSINLAFSYVFTRYTSSAPPSSRSTPPQH